MNSKIYKDGDYGLDLNLLNHLVLIACFIAYGE